VKTLFGQFGRVYDVILFRAFHGAPTCRVRCNGGGPVVIIENILNQLILMLHTQGASHTLRVRGLVPT
jgi:hypothetical protein